MQDPAGKTMSHSDEAIKKGNPLRQKDQVPMFIARQTWTTVAGMIQCHICIFI